jgi:redox-sensitive bicupin YhaK (pirin superfamily)
LIQTVAGQETSDGAGVRLRRSIGTATIDHIDPFLLFDEFKSDRAGDYIAGFPDHPHRGFETVTYMLAGSMEHRDHAGNRGNLVAGSVQWMTAGRGIIHSEMPKQEDGLMWGFQLWVNLPARDKMTEPRYQDIPPQDVPEVQVDGGRVRIIAGELADGGSAVRGPIEGIVTGPVYFDVAVNRGQSVTLPLGQEKSGFVYAFEGEGAVGDPPAAIPSGSLGILGPGDQVKLEAGTGSFRVLLVGARPIGEPVARYGPFVMNTRAELEEAFTEYRNGTFLDPR